MAQLTLLSTLGCHLCEQAEDVLQDAKLSRNFEWEIVDIADSDSLVEAYGVRIPVVLHKESGNEIGWPFDLKSFVAWLEGC